MVPAIPPVRVRDRVGVHVPAVVVAVPVEVHHPELSCSAPSAPLLLEYS